MGPSRFQPGTWIEAAWQANTLCAVLRDIRGFRADHGSFRPTPRLDQMCYLAMKGLMSLLSFPHVALKSCVVSRFSKSYK